MPGEEPSLGKTLLGLLRINKKSKKRKEKTEAGQGEAGLGEAATVPGTSYDGAYQRTPEALAKSFGNACATNDGAAASADVSPGVHTGTTDVPSGTAEIGVPHERLLAALESAQNTDALYNSTRLSCNPPDLSGILFAQRTKTESGTGLALPLRLADGTASAMNSGEAPRHRSVADGANGSYVPYGTTTVGPIHSAAQYTNQDSTALNSVTHNLQDMLYADYDVLERMQSRPDRSPGAVTALTSSKLPRRDARAPDVPSNLGPRGLAPKTTPQLPALPAEQELIQASSREGATASSSIAMPPDRMSVPLGPAPKRGAVPLPQQLPQLQQQQLQPAVGTPTSPARAGHTEPQQPRVEVQPLVATSAAATPQKPSSPQQPRPQPQPPVPTAVDAPAANGGPIQPLQAGPQPAPEVAPLQPAAVAPQVGPAEAHAPPAAPPEAVAVPAAARWEATQPAATSGTVPPSPFTAAELIRQQEAAAEPGGVAAPALPPSVHGVQGDRPVPLSRPLKLTTACLGAHTTLCDSATDQSFQRTLQRKMQMVFKWLQASDLTAAPDPRLEVPLAPEASSPHGGADGAERPSQRPGAEAGVAREGSSDRPGMGGAGSRMPGGAYAYGGAAAAHAGGTAPGGGVAVRGGQGIASGYVFRSARGPPLLTAEEIAALEAIASATASASRVQQPRQAVQTPATQGQQPQPPQPQEPRQETHQQGLPSVSAAGMNGAAAAPNGSGAVASGAVPAASNPAVQHPPLGAEHRAAADALLRAAEPHPQQQQQQLPQPPHPVAEARVVHGSELATAPGSHRSPARATDAQFLQHSLSDLYMSAGQLPQGTNLPSRVLAGSDDALLTTAASQQERALLAAAAAAPAPAPGPAGAALPAGGSGGVAAPTGAEAAEPSPAAAANGGGGGGGGGGAHGSGQRHASGAVAPPTRTKTIAVASHCPPELQPQPPSASWSIDDFTLLKKLYEGSLSVVCQAQHKRSKRHVALKIYKRSRLHEMERFQLAREICLHIRIVHPHVVALYAAWKDSKYVYLALEWAPQGNMFDFLVSRGGRLGEEEAARVVLKPLFSALAFLHSQHFIHRDVKLENLLLDASCNLKLADFGLAIDQKFEQANTRLGTFGYFAPEVLDCPLKKGPFDLKDASIPGYDSRVDVWSAGVVGYEVLTGRAPFSASSPAKIIQAIRSRVLEFPGISDEGRDFLSNALIRDPAARPTARQLLSHPWILRHCRASPATGPAVAMAAVAPVPPPLSQPVDEAADDENPFNGSTLQSAAAAGMS